MSAFQVGELCKQVRGVSYSKEDASDHLRAGYVPVLRANNIVDGELNLTDLVYVPEARVKSNQLLKKGDILIAASSGSLSVVGKAATVREDIHAGFGAFCKVLRPNDKVLPRYFGHYFQTGAYRRKVSSLAAGANINNLKNEHFNELSLYLPTLEQQKRIAAILDKADELRAKRRRAIAKLDELLKSVFLEMFGDPVANPKGWQLHQIGNLTEVGTGSTPSREHEEYYGYGVPWVKTTEIDNGVVLATEESVSEAGRRSARLKLYPVGSILIAMYGQGKTRGKSAILGIAASVNQACAVLLPSSAYTAEYGFMLLQLSYNSLRELGRGGNQPNLNLNLVKSYQIPVPPLELQKKYSKAHQTLEAQKTYMLQAQDKQAKLFSSLQARVFSGDLTSNAAQELELAGAGITQAGLF